MSDVGEKISAAIAAIIGVAVLALVLSQRATSASVIGAFFTGMSNLVGVAISPVTGQSVANLTGGGLTGGVWSGSSTASNSTGSTLTGAANLVGALTGGGGLGALGGLFGSSGGSSGGITEDLGTFAD